MKDVALIAVNLDETHVVSSENSSAIENSLHFLEKIDTVEQDTDEVIFGTFPVLVVGEHDIRLEQYSDEGMIFKLKGKAILDSTNLAKQSLAEVLDLLDIHNVYLCGMEAEKEVRQLCLELKEAKIRCHLLKNGLGYVDENQKENFLANMKEAGMKVVEDKK